MQLGAALGDGPRPTSVAPPLDPAAAQEIKATGSDFTIIVQSPDGKRAWRFGARMTVQVSRGRGLARACVVVRASPAARGCCASHHAHLLHTCPLL